MGRQLKKKWNTYAVHETVSDKGERITPGFKTKMELVNHLIENGTEWDKPLNCEIAEKFVFKAEWVPSMVIANGVLLYSFDCLKK